MFLVEFVCKNHIFTVSNVFTIVSCILDITVHTLSSSDQISKEVLEILHCPFSNAH